MKKNATRIVSDAILGMDFESVMVNGKTYFIYPPTIHRLAGAARCMSIISEQETIKDMLMNPDNLNNLPKALSWFIADSEVLADELSKGTPDEIITALQTAYKLVSVQDFLMLSTLARNVGKMVANQKQ